MRVKRMIILENVHKHFQGDVHALHDINLRIKRGEFVFLTGHSGAGKSTLLKLLAMLVKPSTGQIWVDGKLLSSIPKRKIPFYRRRIGVIFQNPLLLDDYTVHENVAIPLIISGFSRHDIPRRVRAALDKVGLLKKEKAKPSHLSAGELQRLGIARAIVHKPLILLADEPTGDLDPALSLEIMQLFTRFQQVGVTVLIATHDAEILQKMPYRTLTLAHGNLIVDKPNGIILNTSNFEQQKAAISTDSSLSNPDFDLEVEQSLHG